MASSNLALPRSRRIKSQRDFKAVRSRGQRLPCGVLILNWMLRPANTTSRVGIVTSRKVGKAHTRSRVRRLLRESFRRHQRELGRPVDLVLVARPSIAGKTFPEVEAHFLAALRRVGLLKSAE